MGVTDAAECAQDVLYKCDGNESVGHAICIYVLDLQIKDVNPGDVNLKDPVLTSSSNMGNLGLR
jgi:hypothetical protein